MAVEPAVGHQSPVWPLPNVTRKRWTFGASRAGGKRKHAGVDLYAPRGSVVLAPEGGQVIATQRFNGPNAHAILVQTDTGPVILFGEVEPGSWSKYGLRIGSRVERGQPIADIGINPGGDQMLHLEMYRRGTTRNHRWYPDRAPPPQLLDPTQYLKTASALDADQSSDPGEDVGPHDTDDHKHDDPGQDADPGDASSSDKQDPQDPVDPSDTLPKIPDIQPPKKMLDSPWLVIAVLAAALFVDWGDR